MGVRKSFWNDDKAFFNHALVESRVHFPSYDSVVKEVLINNFVNN